MEKLAAFFNAFRKGEEVADPTKWKLGQITGNAVGMFILALVALAKAYDIEIPIDQDTALVIGGSIVAVFNVVFTMVTSKKVGVKPAIPVQSEGGADKVNDSTYSG